MLNRKVRDYLSGNQIPFWPLSEMEREERGRGERKRIF
jgi:hypothetical protein